MEKNSIERKYTNFWKILREIVIFWLVMFVINCVVYIPGTSWGVEAVNLFAIALCVFAFTRRRNKRRLMIFLIGGIYVAGAIWYNWGWINAVVHLVFLWRLNCINDLKRPDEWWPFCRDIYLVSLLFFCKYALRFT